MKLPTTTAADLRKFRDELLAEKRRLKNVVSEALKQMNEIDANIEPIDILLGSPPASGKQAEQPARQANGKSGLRDAICDAMREIVRDTDPKRVTAELLKSGFDPGDAKTPLSIRVSNEMGRLARTNVLTKVGKKYRLTAP